MPLQAQFAFVLHNLPFPSRTLHAEAMSIYEDIVVQGIPSNRSEKDLSGRVYAVDAGNEISRSSYDYR